MSFLMYPEADNHSSFNQGKGADTQVHRKIQSLAENHDSRNVKAVFNSRMCDSNQQEKLAGE